jgi:thiamine kinase-like enzyme
MDDREPIPDDGRSSSASDDLVQIVQQLAGVLGQPEGDPQPLEGGITNRNYRARFSGTDYVIRVPGKDTNLLEIDRGAERIANERAARIRVAPPVAAALDDPPAIVTVFVEGHGMDAAGLRQPEVLTEVARSLRALHELGEPLPAIFDSFRIVETYAETAQGRGAELPDAFAEASGHAAAIERALTGPEHEPVPCHNDLLAANFIAGVAPEGGDRGQLWIVDWEYAGMGDRYFDLANFAVNNELGEAAEEALVGDYFGELATPRRLAALRLMRFMSDFREAMWGVVQEVVSELDFDFTDYHERHFDRLRETAADPRFRTWLEQAREPEG